MSHRFSTLNLITCICATALFAQGSQGSDPPYNDFERALEKKVEESSKLCSDSSYLESFLASVKKQRIPSKRECEEDTLSNLRAETLENPYAMKSLSDHDYRLGLSALSRRKTANEVVSEGNLFKQESQGSQDPTEYKIEALRGFTNRSVED